MPSFDDQYYELRKLIVISEFKEQNTTPVGKNGTVNVHINFQIREKKIMFYFETINFTIFSELLLLILLNSLR
jgi:hypothetical protein